MRKQFKKIYVEITNHCNLSCSFCSKTERKKQFITREKFDFLLKEIKPYTDYIYLHVEGEPLLHPELDSLLTLCDKYQIKVNITTNGTLFSSQAEMLSHHNSLHQINFSLHSEQNNPQYCEKIFENVEILPQEVLKVYRFWTMKEGLLSKQSTEIVEKIISYYHLPQETVEKLKQERHIRIKNNIFVDKQEQFIWPSLENDFCSLNGYCYGLKSHIAILVDGTVVPCCLDSKGEIPLGNIYEERLEILLKKDRTLKIKNGFQERKAVEALCRHCSYKNRF